MPACGEMMCIIPPYLVWQGCGREFPEDCTYPAQSRESKFRCWFELAGDIWLLCCIIIGTESHLHGAEAGKTQEAAATDAVGYGEDKSESST